MSKWPRGLTGNSGDSLGKKNMVQISVVIPSYNSQDYLPDTLEGLSRQRFDGEFEVVLVDCSETDVVKKLCDCYHFVRYEYVSERFSPGVGRNIGAEIGQGVLLAFLDSDVVLLPNSLQNAWNHYSSGNEVFGGALELNEKVGTTIASYFEHYYYNHESQRHRPVCQRSNLSSALMFVDRKVFIEHGGFKDIPRIQDTEFTERLVKHGYSLSFTPLAVGLQIQDSSFNKVLRKIHISGRNLYFVRYQGRSPGNKILLFLFLPLLTLLKILRIVCRHLTYQNARNRLITILLTPLFLLGGVFWMGGLYRSMIFGGGISARRD